MRIYYVSVFIYITSMYIHTYCTYTVLLYFRANGEGVVGGDGELGCLCGKAGTSHLCDGSAHSSGCVVNGSNAV